MKKLFVVFGIVALVLATLAVNVPVVEAQPWATINVFDCTTIDITVDMASVPEWFIPGDTHLSATIMNPDGTYQATAFMELSERHYRIENWNDSSMPGTYLLTVLHWYPGESYQWTAEHISTYCEGDIDPFAEIYYFGCGEIGVDTSEPSPGFWQPGDGGEGVVVDVEAPTGVTLPIPLTQFSLEAPGDNWITVEPWYNSTLPAGQYKIVGILVYDRDGSIHITLGGSGSAEYTIECGSNQVNVYPTPEPPSEPSGPDDGPPQFVNEPVSSQPAPTPPQPPSGEEAPSINQ